AGLARSPAIMAVPPLKRRSALVLAPMCWSAVLTALSLYNRLWWKGRRGPTSPAGVARRPFAPPPSTVPACGPPPAGRVFPSTEGEGVVISALNLPSRYRTSARHMNHVADDGTRRSVQAVTRDRHRRELFPTVGLRIIGLVGTEDFARCFPAKYDNLAVDIDA